jgi:D-alanyl-D-alanine carboxypeptidase (penicillin-binding protein 5/6)
MNKVKLILLFLASLCFSVAGYARHAAILIDADTGKILYEEEASHPWYPASLTKSMTLYMTFSALAEGRIQLQDLMTTSYHAAHQSPSKLGLRAGETLSVEDAILAIVTRSANDASVVLAEYLGGSEDNFAVKMTAKAHALGMYDTSFMNATGLPHTWQVTTARDLGLLALKLMRDFPNFYPYFGARSMYFRGRELPGINKFTAKYPGAEGMKTGYTCGSGYNLMSSAQQNGKRLIGVIMGGMSSAQRYELMIEMMDNGFAGIPTINAPDKLITTVPRKMVATPPYQLGCGKGAEPRPVIHSAAKKPRSFHHRAAKVRQIAPQTSRKPVFKASKPVVKSKPNKTRYRRS